uniref:Uncharacterized protein n=1 Tax=Rhipicephalus appendiculatus TaxID=34631 RepID=A0A131YFA5_RHIAP
MWWSCHCELLKYLLIKMECFIFAYARNSNLRLQDAQHLFQQLLTRLCFHLVTVTCRQNLKKINNDETKANEFQLPALTIKASFLS